MVGRCAALLQRFQLFVAHAREQRAAAFCHPQLPVAHLLEMLGAVLGKEVGVGGDLHCVSHAKSVAQSCFARL